MTLPIFFTMILSFSNPWVASDLDDPLWRGAIHIEVDGPLYTQYLANTLDENKRRIVGFIKEKGHMKVQFALDLKLTVNALGEYELEAQEAFDGDYSLTREVRSTERKEIVQGGVKAKPKFHVSKTTVTRVSFENRASFDADNFDVGNLRVLPSGKLDKKGRLVISGDLRFEYSGSGTFLENVEQQPKDIDGINKRVKAEVSKTFILPLTFEMSIELKGDPVSGAGSVSLDVANPFAQTEEDDTSNIVYKDQLVGKATYAFTPLFDKKKRKKGK